MFFNNYLLLNEESFKDAEKDIDECMENNRGELIKWAKDCNKFFNPYIYSSEKMFDTATRYLINDNYGKYTDDDIKYLIYYFSKRLFKDLNMKGMKADISYGEFYTDYAVSNYDYKNGVITFYIDKFKDLKKNKPDLLNGLMLIFYEIYRANQENIIRSNSINFDINDYIIALETINTCSADGFYANNYEKLIKENKASIFAFLGAAQYLKNVKPDIEELSNEKALDSVIDMYNNNINEQSLTLYGIEGERLKQLDLGARNILKINPSLVLKYPILLYGFDVTGKRKNLVELSLDYEKVIKLYPDKKEDIDKFYKVLVTERYYFNEDRITLDDDVKTLKNYIKRKKIKNKFYHDLLGILEEKYDFINDSKKYIKKEKNYN